MNTKKLTTLAFLTAVSLILYLVELRLPSPVPIPGVKLGLANIITVTAVYYFRPHEAALLVAARLILGAIFGGGFSVLFFSASGAALCLLGMLFLHKIIPIRCLWICSVIGAMFHNVGQLLAAACVLGSPGVFAYLPILLLTGSAAGLFTGLCAAQVLKRLPKAPSPEKT